MSCWRELLCRRFWLCVLAVMMTMALLTALGAWLCVSGWLPYEWSYTWMLGSWCIGAATGARCLHGGREGSMRRALLLCLTVYLLVLILAVAGQGSGLETPLWWQVGVALLAGGFLSALPGPCKKHHRRKGHMTFSRRKVSGHHWQNN